MKVSCAAGAVSSAGTVVPAKSVRGSVHRVGLCFGSFGNGRPRGFDVKSVSR